MPIETANFISQLDPTNPAAPDLLADTDNHLRMIKQVLKNTFPNINSPVSSTPSQLMSNVPVGGIIMWSGSVVPSGWGLCNGATYTRLDGAGSIVSPNLSDKFILASNATNTNVGTTGGSLSKTATSSAAGAHSHTGVTTVDGAHNHSGQTTAHALTINEIPSHAHTYAAIVEIGGGGNGLYFPSNNLGAVVGVTSSVGSGAAHLHGVFTQPGHSHVVATDATAAHVHTVTIADISPPFAVMAYIIKL